MMSLSAHANPRRSPRQVALSAPPSTRSLDDLVAQLEDECATLFCSDVAPPGSTSAAGALIQQLEDDFAKLIDDLGGASALSGPLARAA